MPRLGTAFRLIGLRAGFHASVLGLQSHFPQGNEPGIQPCEREHIHAGRV